MKFIKYLLIAILLIVLLAVAGIGIFVASFDPNSYKAQIEQLVADKTGRELRLKGELGMSLFPKIGLDLGEAELGNAPGFGEQPFASVEVVRLNVALLPLLKRQIEVDTIVLNGLQVDLQRNKDGVTNWADLIQAEEEGAGPAEAPQPAPEKTDKGEAADIALQVKGLQIKNARLSFKDEQEGTSLKLDPFNLETGALAVGQPMPLKMDMHLVQAPDTDLTATLTAMITLDPKAEQYRLDELKLAAQVKKADLPGGGLDLSLAANAAADLKAQTAVLEGLVVETLGLKAEGGLKAEQIQDAPTFNGEFRLAQFNPRQLLEGLGNELPPTADPAVLKTADLSFNINGTEDSVKLSGIKMRLDDSQMTGDAGVSNFEKPAIRVNLALDAIDLDRYSAPESAAAKKGGVAPTGGGSGGGAAAAAEDDLGIPSEQLRELDAVLNFKVGKLILQKARLSDAVVGITARNGIVKVDPFKANLYQGTFSTTVTMDVRGDTPKFTITENLTGVQSAPLLKDMYGDSYLSGKANMQAKITTRGNQVSAVKRNMNGSLSLAFKEGSVNDSKLSDQLNKVIAVIEKRQYDPGQAKGTNFSSLTATAKIKNGVIDNRDMYLKAPKFQVKGLGTASLVSEKVDYQLRLMRPGTGEGQIYAPIDVKGSFDNLSYDFNEQKYTQQLIDREKKKVEKKARDRVDEEVDKALKGLFGR